MGSQSPWPFDREHEVQSLVALGDTFFVEHGRFPSKIRVGEEIARHLIPPGARRVAIPHYTVEWDPALGAEDVRLDP